MYLLYTLFTQLYAALRTLRKAKTLYATLRTWQLADEPWTTWPCILHILQNMQNMQNMQRYTEIYAVI